MTDIECLWQVSPDCTGRAEYAVRERLEENVVPYAPVDPMLYPTWPACDPCAMFTRHNDENAEVIPIPDWVREQVG